MSFILLSLGQPFFLNGRKVYFLRIMNASHKNGIVLCSTNLEVAIIFLIANITHNRFRLSGHILVTPIHLPGTSIEMDMVPGSLATSRFFPSFTTTLQVMVVSVVLSGERVSMDELEVTDELMEIRPPANIIALSLSHQEKENSMSPLFTTLWSRLAEQVRVIPSIPPATKESVRNESDTFGAETGVKTRLIQ